METARPASRARWLPTLTFAALGLLSFTDRANAANATPDGETLFVQRVLPLFRTRCFACHGADEDKLKAEFVLLTRDDMLKGGESGVPAVVPGKPGDSPLYLAITREHERWEPMPPKENDRLSLDEIGAIQQWIAAGAPWPSDERQREIGKTSGPWTTPGGVTVATSGGLSLDWTARPYQLENLWAYQPLRQPALPASVAANAHPIDAFIDARLATLGLAPAPAAERRTLLRRVTFDLTGLPPTPDETAAFLTDGRSDDDAFTAVIDRLLASPHYGEHWGRHWLDVARYADSSGFANDYARGNAWRYRDYVVRAFNTDKPYDQFVREQIAGDEIAESQGPAGTAESDLLVAPGFLRMGPWELTAMEVPKVARQRFLDDATDIVGQVFLGHMLQCARCHDHKFDPIPTRDYYGMQAVFATTQLAEREAPFQAHENQDGFDERKYLDERRREHVATLQALDARAMQAADQWFEEKGADRTAWDAVVAEVRVQAADPAPRRDFSSIFDGTRGRLLARQTPEDQFPPKLHGFTPEELGRQRIANKGLARLRWEFERYQPIAFTVYSGLTPTLRSVDAPARMPDNRMTTGEREATAILGGGDPFSPTQPVQPIALSAVDAYTGSQDPRLTPAAIPGEIAGRRTALAAWMTQPAHPLTARVMANRIWQWHFGRGLAGNPNNFGATGAKPTHPELLDWLAATFVEQGWSVKQLHRLILSSAAYRRGTVHPSPQDLAAKDPDGTSLAAFHPRRLSAEELRDAMLRVSGELNPAVGGIPIRPEMNREAALQPRQVMGTFAEAWQPSPLPAQRHRRSLYALTLRGQPDPFMEVFNAPSPELSCEARAMSTVTPQVFSLFNSEASHDRALAFAARVRRETTGRDQAIARAFALAHGRAPAAAELASCLRHWDRMTERHRSITFVKPAPPRAVVREAVEENTGEKFTFTERLGLAADFVPDLKPADVDAETRALADVCLVLLNANEFAYVY